MNLSFLQSSYMRYCFEVDPYRARVFIPFPVSLHRALFPYLDFRCTFAHVHHPVRKQHP